MECGVRGEAWKAFGWASFNIFGQTTAPLKSQWLTKVKVCLTHVTHQLRLCSVSSYRWDPGRRNSFYDNKCFEQIMQSTVLTYHSGVGEIWSKEEVDVHFLSAENTQLPFLQATLCPQAGRWVVLYIQTSCFLRLYLIVPPSQRVGHCLFTWSWARRCQKVGVFTTICALVMPLLEIFFPLPDWTFSSFG